MLMMALTSSEVFANKTVKVDEYMIQMPGSVDQIALDYVFCKSNDKRRSMRQMTERMEAARVVNAAELARAYLKTGFCKRVIKDIESSVKGLRKYYLKVTMEAGLAPNMPFTDQTEDNGTTSAKKAGGVFKKIGKFLGKIFGGGGGVSGSSKHTKTTTSSTTTSSDGSTTTTSERTKVCDVSFELGGSSGGGRTPPFNPEVPPAG